LSLLIVGLKRRRLLFGVPLLTFVVVVVATFLWPRSYTAEFTFVPQVSGNANMSGAAGLAAQFGINVAGLDLTQSPAFYADLLRSDAAGRFLALTPYHLPRGKDSLVANAITIFDVNTGSAERDAADAAELLMERVKVATDVRTGIVHFAVNTRESALSFQIAKRAVDYLDQFNNSTRRSQAGAERRFIEQRLNEGRRELLGAEDRLRQFLVTNRDYINSPTLSLEHDRIGREVTMWQEVYTGLRQQYEQARQSEVRDTPEITLVEPPVLPARPDRRRLLVKGLLAILAGAWLAIVIAATQEFLARRRVENADEVEALESLARDSIRGILWRRQPQNGGNGGNGGNGAGHVRVGSSAQSSS
jgi:uncharacterized protein involved in exopolysaccharide biosynthesis